MIANTLTGSLAVLMLLCTTMVAGDDVNLKDVKCLLNPKAAAKADKAVDYKGGKVYFCCGGCAGKFSADKEKFSTKANHQLVATGQFKQEKCPMSGGKVNAEQTAKVGGVKVSFCCGNCKGKVEKAESLDEKAALVFSEKAFKKAFVKVKKEKK